MVYFFTQEGEHMTDSEKLDKLIEAVSQINDRLDKMDSRFDKMDSRFDIIELKQDRTEKKVEDLQIDIAVAERKIKRDIHELKDEMETVIEVLKMNELIPR